jgi:hypothetical protein
MEPEMEYTDMIDEEYDALDEELIRTVPKLGPNESDWLRQRELRLWNMSTITVNYLLTKATANHKTPAQIIDELVGEKIAAAAV